MAEFVELAAIRLDGGTQPRAAIMEEIVTQYAEDYGRGDSFPPMVLFFDGADYWLADGFHRYHAAKGRGVNGLNCDVRQGTQRDAILYSVGCNADHGLRGTNEDKRRAVMRLLNDPEWAAWADREIARACRVHHELVGRLRPAEPSGGNARYEESAPRTVQRGGSTYTMNTAPIGRRPAPLPPVTQPSAVPIRESAFAEARQDMDDNGPLFDAIEAIKTNFGPLPNAEETAQRFPRALRHTFSAAQARFIGEWFLALADAWAKENGEQHVIAAE